MSTISRPWSGSASRIFGKAVSALLLAATLSLTGCGDGTRVNMFEGTTAEQAMTELSRKIGHPARAFNVDITPLSLAVRVQDPAKPSHIDEYKLEHVYALRDFFHYVSVTGPTPFQPTLVNNNLEENLFDLNKVNIADVAETAKSAVNRAALEEGGAVAKIHIQRHLYLMPKTHSGEVEWEIQVKSDREYANAYADARGRINHLNLDGTNRARNLNLYTDAKELQNIAGMMREVFGNTPGILRLVLYRNYVSFDARDPQKSKKLTSYIANLNGVTIGLAQTARDQQLSDKWYFAVNDVDWSLVPKILKQAQIELQMPKGDLSLITLGKPAFEGDVQALRWAVQIRDEQGEFGEVEFNPGGAVMQVKLPASRQVHLSMFNPDGAGRAIVGIKKRFGAHARLIELAFDEHSATITAPNPKQPGHLRDFIYSDDRFSDYVGTDMTPFYRGFNAESFFDLDEIEAALPRKLAQLEKITLDRLRIANGKIERITITKHPKMQPIQPKVTLEIRANSGDRSGWVTFDMQGNVISVSNP